MVFHRVLLPLMPASICTLSVDSYPNSGVTGITSRPVTFPGLTCLRPVVPLGPVAVNLFLMAVVQFGRFTSRVNTLVADRARPFVLPHSPIRVLHPLGVPKQENVFNVEDDKDKGADPRWELSCALRARQEKGGIRAVLRFGVPAGI